jgi:hypothetical protein
MTERGELRFTFPLPPNIANARMHWRVKLRAKKDFFANADTMQMFGDFPPPPKQRISKARIRAKVYAWNKGDTGNVMNRMKWIEDWLVTRGYLEDDSEKHLQWEGFPEQLISRKVKQVEITITPVRQP